MARRYAVFSQTVKTEGGLLPVDYLLEIAALNKEIEGLDNDSYNLSEREKINEVINAAYSRLQGFWLGFKDGLEKLPPDDYATSATKEKWLLPLFECLGYGRLFPNTEAIVVDDRQYKTSHMWQNVPIHMLGFRVDLDKRSSAGGARTSSPHSLVQELLNQSDAHLWAFVSNGRKLRLLRDNVSLTKQAYIEFDLEAIFEGDGYADFRLLWLLCHRSRVTGTPPETCWLEKWKDAAQKTGIKVRDKLREGVENALQTLGSGFLRHRANQALKNRIQNNELDSITYYRQLLRIIYRLLFLFVTEDKGLLLAPEATPTQKKIYYNYYSTMRLRKLAIKRRGTKHHDLWNNLVFIFQCLSNDQGCQQLGLPALGSFLWSEEATPDFNGCSLSNADLLETLRHLCFTEEDKIKRPVQYGQLESEELGSIYESLLEQIPVLDTSTDLPTFSLQQAAGNERKTTGSYYTPTSLVNCLLNSALEPALKQAIQAKDPENAILNLKICDPACGSGHFLIAAAHKVAKQLASVRTGDLEPGPEYTSKALRDVTSRCIYGVDVNEMAVELCKVSLWLQSAMPGAPLSFLDHKIKCGNSLLGTTPALIEKGIPDCALDPIEGDDKEVVKQVKAFNKKQMDSYPLLSYSNYSGGGINELASSLAILDVSPDSVVDQIHKKEQEYQKLLGSDSYLHEKYICDAWCAAFVWKLSKMAPLPITRDVFGRIRSDYRNVSADVRQEILRLQNQYKFFHWHLEFPQVFSTEPLTNSDADDKDSALNRGGFDVILGNPPWERVKLQEQEWFASRVPEIAQAPTKAIRGQMIATLGKNTPAIYQAFLEDRRQAEGESHLVRKSGRYPLCGRGDVNTYSIFAESIKDLMAPKGYAGFIVQSGIATDDTTKFFFRNLVENNLLVSLYDFENRRKLFPIDGRIKFSLITLAGQKAQRKQLEIDFVFFALDTIDLADEDKHFTLTAEDLALLNPNTGTCAIFRSKKDAEITKKIYRQVPVLIKEGPPEENPWGIKFSRLFDMSNDSNLFRSKKELEGAGFKLEGNIFAKGTAGSEVERFLPLYEAKMIHHFDHRWATYDYSKVDAKGDPEIRDVTLEEKQDPNFVVLPRHWVAETEVKARLAGKWDQPWLLGWRDICRNTDERTLISALFPQSAVGNQLPLLSPEISESKLILCLAANLSSFALDFVVRQKAGGTHINFFIAKQLPIISPATYLAKCPWQPELTYCEWFSQRIVPLVFTGNDMLPPTFCKTINFSEVDRRNLIAEINAAFFLMLQLDNTEVQHIMQSFPIVKQQEHSRYGDYRLQELIMSKLEFFQSNIFIPLDCVTT